MAEQMDFDLQFESLTLPVGIHRQSPTFQLPEFYNILNALDFSYV